MRRFFVMPLIIIVCLPLTGCGFSGSIYSNYRAIEDLQPVQTLGIDGSGGQLTLTAAVSATESSGVPTVLRCSGSSMLSAMDALQDYTARGELFFAHTQSILLGEDYAADGLGPLLDFVERDVHMRLGTDLYVIRSGSAEALITGAEGADADITALLASAKRTLELRGVSHVSTFRETAVALSECGAALICALQTAETAGHVYPEADVMTAIPAGYGILRGDRLIGFLDGRTAEAASLLSGKLGTVARSILDGLGSEVTLEISGKSELQPAWNEDGSPAPLRVDVQLSAVLAEPETVEAPLTDAAVLETLSAGLSRQVEDDLRGLLSTAQTLDADFLSLAQTLRRSSGKNFAALPENWLQTLEFEIHAETRIVHSYDLSDLVPTKGETADAAS